MTEGSQNDQKGGKGADRGTLLPMIILLALPAAIPLFFLGQAERSENRALLIGLSVCVALANLILIRVVMRWFAKNARGE